MIALIVLLALCFAWGCVATSVAVAKELERRYWEISTNTAHERINEIQDRQQASSLSEYHAARVAMQAPGPAPDVTYRYDDFGMTRDIAPDEPEATE